MEFWPFSLLKDMLQLVKVERIARMSKGMKNTYAACYRSADLRVVQED